MGMGMVRFGVIHMLPIQSHYLRFMIVATCEKYFEALNIIVLRHYEELERVSNLGKIRPAPPKTTPKKARKACWLLQTGFGRHEGQKFY